MDQHHRHFQWLICKYFVDRLIPPVCVVTRMLENLSPEANLFKPTQTTELTCGNGFHEHVVVVVVTCPPFYFVRACSLLIVNVAHSLLAEGAVMKPIVAHPSIDHRVHWHRNFKRRVRINKR